MSSLGKHWLFCLVAQPIIVYLGDEFALQFIVCMAFGFVIRLFFFLNSESESIAYKPFEFVKLLLELAYVRLLSPVWMLLLSHALMLPPTLSPPPPPSSPPLCWCWWWCFVVEPTKVCWLLFVLLNPWHGRLFSIWFRKFEKFCIIYTHTCTTTYTNFLSINSHVTKRFVL